MSEKNLLEIKDLYVNVEEKEILHGVNLEVGKIRCMSSWDQTEPENPRSAMRLPDIRNTPLHPDTFSLTERISQRCRSTNAPKRNLLSFQNPLEVPGVTLSAFIRNALEQKTGKRVRLWDFKKKLTETMKLLSMDESYAERDLNVGFSGGEKKKQKFCRCLC